MLTPGRLWKLNTQMTTEAWDCSLVQWKVIYRSYKVIYRRTCIINNVAESGMIPMTLKVIYFCLHDTKVIFTFRWWFDIYLCGFQIPRSWLFRRFWKRFRHSYFHWYNRDWHRFRGCRLLCSNIRLFARYFRFLHCCGFIWGRFIFVEPKLSRNTIALRLPESASLTTDLIASLSRVLILFMSAAQQSFYFVDMLYWIACLEEPPRSFNCPSADVIIELYFGRSVVDFAYFDFLHFSSDV